MHQDKIKKKSELLPKSKMAIEKQVVYLSKQLMVVYIWIGEFMFNFKILHPLLTDQYQFEFKHCL